MLELQCIYGFETSFPTLRVVDVIRARMRFHGSWVAPEQLLGIFRSALPGISLFMLDICLQSLLGLNVALLLRLDFPKVDARKLEG